MEKTNEKTTKTVKEPRRHRLYCHFMFAIGKLIYKRRSVCYERAPEDKEVAIFACNHSGMVGPVNMCAWFDRPFSPWSICYLFDNEVAPNYVFHDFFFGRSKKHKKLYRGLSKIVAKLLPPLLRAFQPIKVYHNSCSIIHTFKESVATLASGKNLVIFPESPSKFSEYVSELYDGFVEVAGLYYKLKGVKLKFYPVYIPSDVRIISVGEPITFDPEAKMSNEKKRIVDYLKLNIDRLGRALPTKKFIPFMREEFYDYYPEFIANLSAYWQFCAQKRSD